MTDGSDFGHCAILPRKPTAGPRDNGVITEADFQQSKEKILRTAA